MLFCKLYENKVDVALGTQGGEVKTLSLSDFIKSISVELNRVSNGEGGADIVEYPLNLLYVRETIHSKLFVLYYPETTSRIQFGEKSYNVALPNVIITAEVEAHTHNEWKLKPSSVYFYMTPLSAVEVPRCSHPTQLLEHSLIKALAMPNMYQGGNMCVGANTFPMHHPSGRFRGINWLHNILVDSPFNSDLSIPGVPDTSPYEWIRRLEDIAQRQDPFPYHRFFRGMSRPLSADEYDNGEDYEDDGELEGDDDDDEDFLRPMPVDV